MYRIRHNGSLADARPSTGVSFGGSGAYTPCSVKTRRYDRFAGLPGLLPGCHCVPAGFEVSWRLVCSREKNKGER